MKKNKFVTYFLLFSILAFGLFLRSYNLGDRYGFEWDQDRDAVAVSAILNGKFTLIGPRVAGPDSFFVAPWHYYFLVPFYGAFSGDPIAGAWAAVFVGLVTVGAYYWVGSKLWGEKQGLVAAWAGAVAYSIIAWNVMYTPLLSIIIFYLGYRYFDNQRFLWLSISLAIFSGTNHLVPGTMIFLVLAAYLLVKKKPPVSNFVYGSLIGLLCISPLIMFDLRHNFLIFHKIGQFMTASGEEHSGFLNLLAWRAYYRGLGIMLGLELESWLYILERLFLSIAAVSFVILIKERVKKIWVLIWLLLPAFVLLFYWKNIPEYYFGVPLAIMPLVLAYVSSKYRLIIVLFLMVVSLNQFNFVIHEEHGFSLNDKKDIVNFMTKYTVNKHFNFSYDVPFGEEVGYPYLFSWSGHEPENIPEASLFTLSRSPLSTEKVIYSNKGISIIQR